MFTGLITAVGRITRVGRERGGLDLDIAAPYRRLVPGESIAVDGACLTVARKVRGGFGVRAITTTLDRTLFGQRQVGDRVNLERALAAGDRLGGHLVQGHVDGVGEVVSIANEGDGWRVRLRVPAELRRFVAEKGSLTVDGVSLTVAAVTDDGCEIAYIPHTLAVTTSGTYQSGRRVNLEVDLLARYLARLLEDAGSSRRSL